jgi:DNA-binding response OmpR family regulator
MLKAGDQVHAPRKRILVVEDDLPLARVLVDNLTFAGFDADHADEARSALSKVRSFSPDLVLLDLMLPGGDGVELCRLIRRSRGTPVIVLTARSDKADKLRGLGAGADDYVTKPFDFDELNARIWAVLRRVRLMVERMRLGKLTIDFTSMTATEGDRLVHLTRREFDLLSYLAERRGAVVHRRELLREVWGFLDEPSTRAVDYAIKRLRAKVEPNPHAPQFILTVHGDGYSLTCDIPAP